MTASVNAIHQLPDLWDPLVNLVTAIDRTKKSRNGSYGNSLQREMVAQSLASHKAAYEAIIETANDHDLLNEGESRKKEG